MKDSSNIGLELGGKEAEMTKIPVESLSNLIGFPIEYVKSELLLDVDEVSIEELRLKMLSFLELNFNH